MQSITSLTLNLQLPNCAVTMYAVQNDRKTRRIQATLFDGDTAWTPPVGAVGMVRFVKSDGTQGFYEVDEDGNTAVTWVGNVATIRLAEQALTVAGDVYCQVNFYNASEERLSTFSWLMKVQKCVVTDDTIISTDYFNILSQEIAEILEIYADLPTPSTSNPLMDGTASAGSTSTYSRGDHRHPTDTSRAPTNHASTATTYGAASTSNYGHVKLSNTTPIMDGTAAVGDSTDVARANHVHPSDTSRVPTTRKINGMDLSQDRTLTSENIGYNSSTTYSSGTVGKAVSELNGAITSSVTKLNTNLGYIEEGSTSTRQYNAGEYIIFNGYLCRVTAEINVGDAFSTSSNITVVKVGTEFVSMKRSTVEKLRVCQYNIGKFNYGNSGGISGTANVERAIANYRTFFANENIDFLTLQEIVQYIGVSNTYDAEQWLFSDFFKSTSHYEKETKIKSQYKLTDTAFSYLHTSGDPSAWCIYGKTKVQGSEIMIVSGVLNVTSDTAQKQRALTKLCDTIIGSTENAIIGMDVNVNSESEADAIATFMTNKGYKFGNWGFLGKQKTYNLNSSVYQCIDNIFVKGSMRITNFTVPDVYSGLTSDHYPVIAEIDFLVQKD